MNEFSIFHGYKVKDKKARELVDLETKNREKAILTESSKRTSENDTMKKYVDSQIDSVNKSINNVNNRVSGMAALPEGSTSLDAEVIDIRLDHEGVMHANAGDSVRYHTKRLSDAILNISECLNIGYKMVTEMGTFNQTEDITIDTENSTRGRSKPFTLTKPMYVGLSDDKYQYYVAKQVGNEITWTSDAYLNEPSLLDDLNCIYRIMFRAKDNSSLSDVDFTSIFITCEYVDYITDYVFEEQALYNAVKNEIDSNTIIIPLVADTHYHETNTRNQKQPELARTFTKIAERLNSDFMVHLGDMIEGVDDSLTADDYKYQYVNYERISEMMKEYTDTNVPFVYVPGHHEMYPINDVINENEFTENRGYSTFMLGYQTKGNGSNGFRRTLSCVDDVNSLSYYFDFVKGSTIRFLVIDGCSYSNRGFSLETISFINDCLIDAKLKNYPVVVFCHIPLFHQYITDSTQAKSLNEDLLINTIKESNAEILAFISGHVHCDNIVTENDDVQIGYPIITVNSQSLYRCWSTKPDTLLSGNPTCPQRTMKDYTEYCFDVLLLNTTTKTLKFYRFGAGDTGVYPTREL